MHRLLIFSIVMLLLMLTVVHQRLAAESSDEIRRPFAKQLSNNTRLDEFKKYLEKLDPSNIESILIAKTELISNFKTASTHSDSDAALRMFLDFYSKTIEALKKDFLNQREYQTVLNQTGGLRFNPSDDLQKNMQRQFKY